MDNKREREYRSIELSAQNNDYMVHGHASTFEAYPMWSDGDVTYYERVSKGAFDGCDMSDVVLRVDHGGQVYARTSAGTLNIRVDESGLAFDADLSKTTKAKELFEDIKAGNYRSASFAFVVEADHYEAETHTRVIDAFRKIYDVGPATWAANPATDVSIGIGARDYFTAQEEAIAAVKKHKELERKRLALRLKID